MPGTTLTVSSGSGERIILVNEGDPAVLRGGRSLESPASTESQSGHSSVGSFQFVDKPLEYDDAGRSESVVSRSRRSSSRRYQPEAPSVPTRRRSSRSTVQEQEYRPTTHRSRSSRQYIRSESRRIPSDESTSTVASQDDYPHAYHGHPSAQPPRGYSYRHVAPGHGGAYPPPPGSVGGYDAFSPEALVHMPRDAFGYPVNNAFSGGQNPFAPMAPPPPQQPPSAAYGYPDPMAAPQRPVPMSRMSMYAGGYPGDGYHAQMMQSPYAMYAPPMPYMHSQPASPPPESNAKEFEALKEMIKKHDEERLAWEKALVAKQEAEAAAKAAAAARAEEEKKKKAEIADASKAAKEAAEKKAADDAKKAADEAQKKLDEAKKAKEEAEKKTKALEEEKKNNTPHPDSSKEPIKFKDAAHRKFSFPWSVCKTWKGMEGLVRQAFAHIDVLGPHVLEGRYDLIGPDGEIILPIVWETTIQPGWEIEMVMWPIDELQPAHHRPHHHDPIADIDIAALLAADPAAGGHKPKKSKSGIVRRDTKGKTKIVVPPPPPSHALDPLAGLADLLPELVLTDSAAGKKKPKTGSSKGKGKEISGFARFMLGGPPPKKKS